MVKPASFSLCLLFCKSPYRSSRTTMISKNKFIVFCLISILAVVDSKLYAQYGGGGYGGGGFGVLPSALFTSVPGSLNPALTDTAGAFSNAGTSPLMHCANNDIWTDHCPVDPNMWSLPTPGGCGSAGCGIPKPNSPTAFSSIPRFPRTFSAVPLPYHLSYTGGNSWIENQRFNYWHSAVDFPKPDGSSLWLCRVHRSRDWSTAGMLGLGVFTNFDYRLKIQLSGLTQYGYGQSGYSVTTHVFDPFSNALVYSKVPQASNPNTLQKRALNATYLNAQLQPITVTNFGGTDYLSSIPAYCRYELFDGGHFLFQLINPEVPPSNPNYGTPTHGRLVEAKTSAGSGFTVAYKNWTTAELEASPSRIWQANTVSDFAGSTMTFTYHAAQQGGHWVVSGIQLPSGNSIAYTYAGGFLEKVVHPDSLESTFTYSNGTNQVTVSRQWDYQVPFPLSMVKSYLPLLVLSES